jgi:hypothetical protein
VVLYLILLIKVSAEWWGALNYFGDGTLHSELAIGTNIPLARGKAGQYLGLFKPARHDYAISPNVVSVQAQQKQEAAANIAGTAFRDWRPR